MLPKPDSCRPCLLYRTGQGFVPRAGALPPSPSRRIAFIAEAAGRNEEAQGVPLVGEAGVMFNRLLSWLSLERSRFLLHNTLSCRPQSNDLLGAPYEREALDHCRPNLESTLALGPDVVVSLGAIATRELLGLHQTKFILKDWHGTVNRDPADRFWVVPTFHPAHLVRGAQSLTGVCLFDIRTALEIADKGKTWTRQEPRLIVDPPVEWFSRWVLEFLQSTAGQEEFFRLSVDVETEDKQGTDEGELAAVQTGQRITRVNFAVGPDEGITVPYEGPYIPWVVMLLVAGHPKLFWNKPFDLGQFRAHGVTVSGVCLDMMWAWHVLQSDVPRGLGFVGPFYLSWKSPWKHLSAADPGAYGAWDGVNNWVIGSGVEADLHSQGMWGVFYHHIHEPDLYLFTPSTEVGLLVDQEQLGRFGEEVKQKAAGLLMDLQEGIPEAVRPLHPKGGWKSDPGPVKPNPEFEEDQENQENQTDELIPKDLPVMELRETALVMVCGTCGEEEVQRRHRCKDEKGRPDKSREPRVVQDERMVSRWYVRRLFNPGSSKQMLGLIGAWKYTPGENKEGRPSADKLSVEGCIRQAAKKGNSIHAQWFRRKLSWGEYGKVHANYVKGTLRRLKEDPRSRADGRLHPEVTHAPSTLRTCIAAGTLIEIVRDVSKYPKGIPIEDVRPGDLAYTFDHDKNLVLHPVLAQTETGTRRVCRIHWRAAYGGTQGYVDLTPDHEVRLVSGEWRQAGVLGVGARVLSLHRGVGRGYARLWATGHQEITREHRFIYEQLWGDVPEVVHHKDGNKLNNLPENLEATTREVHTRHHSTGRLISERERRLHRERTLQLWAEGKFAGHHGPRLCLPKAWLLKVLWDNAGKPTAFRDIYGINYEIMLKYLELHEIDWRAIKRKFNRAGVLIDKELVSTARAAHEVGGQIAGQQAAGLGYYRWREVQEEFGFAAYNHQVTEIEELADPVRVYDLTIAETESFIAGELCVHNSYRRPNLQNVVAHKDLAAGFRRCLIAEPGSVLAEIDYSGIEAVVTGWLAGDPQYIRLAKIGVHAYLCSYLVKEPADLRWPDEELRKYLTAIKKRFPVEYDKAKRAVHGSNYGLTPYGMNERFPEIYPAVRAAQEVQDLYFRLCPKLKEWQESVKRFAAKHHYLGGGGTDQVGSHPFGYKHWFWDVVRQRRITESAAKKRERLHQPWFRTGDGACFAPTDGEDAKRLVAFKPQSIARGIIVEAGLRLFTPGMPNYVGDAWKGKTPLRTLVHDSLLLELEEKTRDEILEKVVLEMRREIRELPLPPEWGMGKYLSIGVAAKVGPNWYEKDMQEWTGTGAVLGPLPTDLTEAMQEIESDPEEEGWTQGERERWTERALVG